MIRHLAGPLALLLHCVFAGPAAAGWMGLEFGSSEAEARSRFPEITENLDRKKDLGELQARLTMPYTVDGIVTEAYLFYAPEGGLAEVRLSVAGESECAHLEGIASMTYGPPEAQEETDYLRVFRWRDPPKKNLVFFLQVGVPAAFCGVSYKPLRTPGAAGGL